MLITGFEGFHLVILKVSGAEFILLTEGSIEKARSLKTDDF